MQWKAIYNKETGLIRCTVATEGQLDIPETEGIIECTHDINGGTHKVNLQTLEFEELPPYEPTAEELQEQINALLARKAEVLSK